VNLSPGQKVLSHGRRVIAWGILVISVTAGNGAVGETVEASANLPGSISIYSYRASVFSFQETGTLLWLAGPDGALRLELNRGVVATAGHRLVDPLLHQVGQGWTAVFGEHSQGTINPWGERWRQPPLGLGHMAQLVGEALAVGPPAAVSERAVVSAEAWRAGARRISRIKFTIPSLEIAAGDTTPRNVFRSESVRRGLGAGGVAEVLELTWRRQAGVDQTSLVVNSTRRPGRLELALLARHDVTFVMPEAFVPLWPLAELITLLP